MKNAPARSNPMIMIGLIVAMALLVGAIALSTSRTPSGAKTILLASGEWAPYVGESLPDNGTASVIVELVFKQMGYQIQYQFMPWALVQNRAEQAQSNRQIRAVFPYIHSQQREGQFYFSDGFLDIAYGVFFHLDQNIQAQDIVQHQDLQRFAILTLQGYEYADEIKQYLPVNSCDLKDTIQGLKALELNPTALLLSHQLIHDDMLNDVMASQEAQRLGNENMSEHLVSLPVDSSAIPSGLINTEEPYLYLYWFDPNILKQHVKQRIDEFHLIMTSETAEKYHFASHFQTCLQPDERHALLNLAYWNKPKVLVEAIEVGESILSSSLPKLAPYIQLSSYSKRAPHRVMFPKNNPNNLGLRDQFNQRLAELRSNQQAYDKLIQAAVNKNQLANAVLLVAPQGETLIRGLLFDQHTLRCDFASPVFFPKGSKALIRQWPEIFLHSKDVKNTSRSPVIAKILNGPLAGNANLFCFSPEMIKLP